ncbi:DUF3592 domain-containing protein [Candidatus Saccharibacteria bacterium]|nr:DUF3592 domain-containing protein [Candidatus Saccharibacteria bacterium]
MTNFKTKRQQFGIGALLLMLIVGAVFTGVGFFILKSTKIDPSWVSIPGTVVASSSSVGSGSTTYAAVVSYQVNGQTYKVTSSSSSSSYPTIGENRNIAYNPVHPDQSKVVQTAGTVWFIYIFPVIGIICLISAPYLFIKARKRNSAISNLMQSGQKMQGVLVDIQAQGANSNSGYKIIVSATNASGTVQNYVSDFITGIGGLAMADFRNTPIPIDVYIDPTNPQNYYVDIADIPNLSPDRIASLLKTALQNRQPNSLVGTQNPALTQTPAPSFTPTPPSNPIVPPPFN